MPPIRDPATPPKTAVPIAIPQATDVRNASEPTTNPIPKRSSAPSSIPPMSRTLSLRLKRLVLLVCMVPLGGYPRAPDGKRRLGDRSGGEPADLRVVATVEPSRD